MRSAFAGSVGNKDLDRQWSTDRIGAVEIETHDCQHFFQVEVSPDPLTRDQLRVELCVFSTDEGIRR